MRMKGLGLCVFLLGAALPALSQEVKPTEIHGVFIGETAQEFRQSAEFANRCQGIASPRMQDVCNEGIKDWAETGMKVELRLRNETVYFEGGAVVRVRVAFNSYADALKAATAKFGPPSVAGFDGDAAAAGSATTGKASVWKMTDGSDVLAYENVTSTETGGVAGGYVVLLKRAPEKTMPAAPEL